MPSRIVLKMQLLRNSLVFLAVLSLAVICNCNDSDETGVSTQTELFTIIGKVNNRLDDLDLLNTRILVDDGRYVGFLRSDGTFSISGLPSNSYVVEVSSPKNVYEPVRVDINSKGKIRARRLNLLQPTDVSMLRYPIQFESKGYPNYFLKREQFRVLDIFMSPMVLMMVVALLLVLVLPKLVNQDPELQRELAQKTSMFQPKTDQMGDLSEYINNLLPGAKKAPVKPPSKYSTVKSRKN